VISGRRWDSGRVAVSDEGFLDWVGVAWGAGILAGRARLRHPFLACVGRRVGTVGIEVSVSIVCVGEVGQAFLFAFPFSLY
jgi:hypothetical protein